MSGSSEESDQGGAGRREVAYRLFAAEYDDADFSYSESDEERAPNYVVTPSGARVNRLFVVGVLTEVEQVNEDVLRARVVDPTGAFVAYAGQYQPDEMAFLDRASPPTFVALTGKARTFQPDDSDTVYTSVRPESINEVDAETRDRWTVATAERTLDRVSTMAGALGREERGDDLRDVLVSAGVDEGLAAGTALALEHYGTTPTYLDALEATALDAARVVAGDVDEVDSLAVAPDEQGTVTVADLDGLELSAGAATRPTATADPESETETAATDTGGAASTTGDTEPSTTDATASTTSATDEPDTESVSGDAGTETAGVETDETPATEPVETEPPDPSGEAAASPDAEPESSDSEPSTAVETGTEPATESADDDVGDFEPGGAVESGVGGADDEEVGDFDPGEFELDEDEREEIEEEYGTDFSTGTEVGDPGEADIETPDPDPVEADASSEPATEPADPGGDAEPATETGGSEPAEEPAESATETAAESGESADAAETDSAEEADDAAEPAADEPDEDVALDDAVMDAMRDLDDGDGADREAVIEQVADRTGADADAVEDAVQDALMDGRCYEPGEATLKPI
jgi:RPA family protein